jgi:hypothetical protein
MSIDLSSSVKQDGQSFSLACLQCCLYLLSMNEHTVHTLEHDTRHTEWYFRGFFVMFVEEERALL